MEPWEVCVRALAEAWAEEDIRSGRYREIQTEEPIFESKEVEDERSHEGNDGN